MAGCWPVRRLHQLKAFTVTDLGINKVAKKMGTYFEMGTGGQRFVRFQSGICRPAVCYHHTFIIRKWRSHIIDSVTCSDEGWIPKGIDWWRR